ncbi:hypothetical protein MCRO_0332 [Mycoplasma crocodyli MP145]|uniref:Uncharacterized protein n=1 Tax=Mycoplasma crocodyli (strain ATCC 51981 / MP145) TaxID=512564 RepID=D5E5D2_MYCCM|nr:hypothetical protein MCRO_0332 [Mycoplasma crocodyli MP145]
MKKATFLIMMKLMKFHLMILKNIQLQLMMISLMTLNNTIIKFK